MISYPLIRLRAEFTWAENGDEIKWWKAQGTDKIFTIESDLLISHNKNIEMEFFYAIVLFRGIYTGNSFSLIKQEDWNFFEIYFDKNNPGNSFQKLNSFKFPGPKGPFYKIKDPKSFKKEMLCIQCSFGKVSYSRMIGMSGLKMHGWMSNDVAPFKNPDCLSENILAWKPIVPIWVDMDFSMVL